MCSWSERGQEKNGAVGDGWPGRWEALSPLGHFRLDVGDGPSVLAMD